MRPITTRHQLRTRIVPPPCEERLSAAPRLTNPAPPAPLRGVLWPTALSPALCHTRQTRRHFLTPAGGVPQPHFPGGAGGSGGGDVARAGRAVPPSGEAPGRLSGIERDDESYSRGHLSLSGVVRPL